MVDFFALRHSAGPMACRSKALTSSRHIRPCVPPFYLICPTSTFSVSYLNNPHHCVWVVCLFLLQQHQIPCNACSWPNHFSPLCLLMLPPAWDSSPFPFTWLTQFQHLFSQEASPTPPCPIKCASSRLPEYPAPGTQSLYIPLHNQ